MVSIRVYGDAVVVRAFNNAPIEEDATPPMGSTASTTGTILIAAVRFGGKSGMYKRKKRFRRIYRGWSTKSDIPLHLPEVSKIPAAAHAAPAASLPYKELPPDQVLRKARCLLKNTNEDKEAIIKLKNRVCDLG